MLERAQVAVHQLGIHLVELLPLGEDVGAVVSGYENLVDAAHVGCDAPSHNLQRHTGGLAEPAASCRKLRARLEARVAVVPAGRADSEGLPCSLRAWGPAESAGGGAAAGRGGGLEVDADVLLVVELEVDEVRGVAHALRARLPPVTARDIDRGAGRKARVTSDEDLDVVVGVRILRFVSSSSLSSPSSPEPRRRSSTPAGLACARAAGRPTPAEEPRSSPSSSARPTPRPRCCGRAATLGGHRRWGLFLPPNARELRASCRRRRRRWSGPC
eukprot:766666-Hanusia_phi.AAC.2